MRDPDNRVHVAPGWIVADPSDEAEARRMIRRHARAVVRRLPAEAQARHAVLDALSLLPPRSLRPIQRAMAGPAWPLVDGALRALARSGHEGAGSGGPLPGEVVRILDRRSRSGASSILAELVGAAAARTRTPVDKLLAALATQRRLVSLLPEIGRLAAMKAPDDDGGPPGPRSFGGEQRPIGDADTGPCARLAVALRHLIRGEAAPDLAATVSEALERGGPAATALLREALGRRAARAGLVALPRPIATRVLLSCVSGPGQAAQVLLPMLAVEPGLLAVLFAAIGEGTTDIMALAAVLRTCRAAAAEDAGPPPQGGTTDDIEVRIDNAGLVLLAPFLGRFFTKLRLTGPDDRLLPEMEGRAVHLLQLLVAGRVDAREHRLVLNKILCGLDLALPIISAIEVTEEEAATADSLLLSVTQAWPPMNGTSIAGLRTTFLQRGGTLHRHREGWRLKVDVGPYDMLLDKLPWPISIVRLRGMTTPLKVDWR